MFILPFENAPQKLFATEISAGFFLSAPQIFFDCSLSCNSGVIHAWQPQHFESLHSRAPGKNILNRVVEHVPECQHTGHVGRRHHDRKRRLGRLRIGNEISIADPALIPFRLNRLRIVSLWKFRHRDESSACLRLAQRNKRKPEACATLFADHLPAA